MKQEIKDRLKKCSKIAVVIGGILLWIVSFIGISAYSVYWLRQNAAYEQENTQRDLKPKNAVSNYSYLFYKLKARSFVDDSLSYYTNTNGYKSYWDIDDDERPQESYNANMRYVFEGDFSIYVAGQSVSYNRLTFNFTVDTSNVIYLNAIHVSIDGTSFYFLYDTGLEVYRDVVVRVTSIYSISSLHVIEKQDLGVINYYFDKLLDTSNNSFGFTFQSGPRNTPNFLSSFTRLQYGQTIIADGVDSWGLSIPMTFESNGILFDKITLIYTNCWFYINSAGQVIENYPIYHGSSLNMPVVCSAVLYGCYGQELLINYDNHGLVSSINNGVLAMYMSYSGFKNFNDGTVDWDLPVFQLVPGLQVVSDYSNIRVADVDTVPFPNTTGNSLLPYNNISIRNILGTYFNFYGDINGYNGTNYDVGLGNVFTLLSDAFQSLIPLLAIQIIPGITLGLLVLLPLVVTIILVIIKLVKK